MLDRAAIVDKNFIKKVKTKNFPKARLDLTPKEAGLTQAELVDLFESQLISRHLDIQARLLKQQGLSFYTIGSSGHEGNAAVAKAFLLNDMAFLHYRSGAFMAQRAKLAKQKHFIYEQLLALVASSSDPIAAGRHKVFGSKALCVPPQTSTIASHLPKAVGAALSIIRAKELNIKTELPNDSVIICSFGDASFNHAVAISAINTTQWIAYNNYPLPIVFICEDNGLGISVPTPGNWIEDNMRARVAIHYIKADGLHLADTYRAAQKAQYLARVKHQPVFLHLKTVRLLGHAGSDIEAQYRRLQDIEKTEADDPLLHSARILFENDYLSPDEIIAMYESVRSDVAKSAQKAIKKPRLDSAQAVMAAILPPKRKTKYKANKLVTSKRKALFGREYEQLGNPRNMCQLLNYALTDLMQKYANILVFGEDVAKKGGVYRVTADLMKRFGQRRVFDSLLDETSILGNAIGFALNGFLPIPEIQFLAYYHNAQDQIRGEAATLPFFSNGQYTNPMVVRIAGFAYQKGFGGHFHNDNSIAVLRDLPGVIVATPSHGVDGAKMLRTCVELAQNEQRVVIFIEPIALYMTKDLHVAGDNAWLGIYPEPDATIAYGEPGIYGTSSELTILTYGNGVYLSRQAAKILTEKYHLPVKIVDLRWLAPLNQQAIIASIKNCKHVLIVDECRKTGSISEELMTLLLENCHPLPKIKRITGHDSFIPLGTSWQYVLPSKDGIVEASLELVGVRQVECKI